MTDVITDSKQIIISIVPQLPPPPRDKDEKDN